MTITFYNESVDSEMSRIKNGSFTNDSIAVPKQAHKVSFSTNYGHVKGICSDVEYTYYNNECIVLVALVCVEIKRYGESKYEKYSEADGHYSER